MRKLLQTFLLLYSLAAVFHSSGQEIDEIEKILPIPGPRQTELGQAIAIDGDFAVVGDWGDDTHSENGGAAYVLEYDGTTWNQIASLSPSDLPRTAHFGFSVAISGEVIVIGARNAESTTFGGAAYVFEKPAGGWTNMTETIKLNTGDDGKPGSNFGHSVAVSGNTIVVGAKDYGNAVVPRIGRVFIFEKNATWTEVAFLNASDEDLGSTANNWDFGNSVAISGGTVVVGANLADNRGAAYVFENNGTWTEEAKLTASDATQNEQLGSSVAISGSTIVASHPRDIITGFDNGSVYVFEEPPTGWVSSTETQKLTASDLDRFDEFGESVSISGNSIAIGAVAQDEKGTNSGAVYLFELNSTTGLWEEEALYTASDGIAFDEMGSAVAISNDHFLVNGGIKVYAHKKPVGGWASGNIDPTSLTPPLSNSLDEFGSFIAIEGNIAVIGAPDTDTDQRNGESAGAAYVLEFDGSNWNHLALLTPSDADDANGDLNGNFGAAVAISGSTIVVGDPQNNAPQQDRGAVYVFEEPAGGWRDMTETDKLVYSGGSNIERFGTSLDIEGMTLAIGTPGDDANRGSVILFTYNGSSWSEDQTLEASDRISGDVFGRSVALDGDVVAVGASGDESGTGAVYLFDVTSGNELSKLTASDGMEDDFFGTKVDFKDDLITVGATGNNGFGAVYLFEKPGAGWPATMTETAKLTAADAQVGDSFGHSISLFEDVLLIGAPDSDSERGSAYIFTNDGGWTESEKLTASDGIEGDEFGSSVFASDGRFLVGSTKHTGDFTESGAVYSFQTISPLPVQVTAPATITNSNTMTYTITFGEAVTGFDPATEPGDITLVNGTLNSVTTIDDITYTLEVTPVTEGAVEVSVPAGVAADQATGALNNAASNTYSVVYDITPPDAQALAAFTLNLDASGNATLTGADIDDGSSDANGIAELTVTPENFDCTDIGENPHAVTLTVTDNAGNTSTASTDVSVAFGAYVDNTLPDVIVITATLPVTLDAEGNASITVEDIDNGSSDDCGVDNIELDRTNFTCDDEGENVVTLTVTDLYGNTNTATATVEVTSGTLWYRDADSDGFGDANTSMASCEQPPGFVADNTDCDDADEDEFPGQTWYADTDSDGFGDMNSIQIACERPVGYVLDNTDCNDLDADINPNLVWYEDSDSDGFGDPDSPQMACEQPAGFVADNTDCDDSDAEINPETIWYADTDQDGFGDENTTQTSCEQPMGYVLDNTDCDDTDMNINPGVVWYRDADNDGFGDATETLMSCEQPLGYIQDNTDCNDENADEQPGQTWYQDGDNDGFGNPDASMISCLQPAGYVLNNTDCEDSDPSSQSSVWYEDNDGDGYGNPDVVQNTCTQPAGYVANNQDCDDSDAAINPDLVWYADADGDGFGNLNIVLTQCDQPEGYVTNSTDCDDSSASINPEAADVAGSGIDANCDGTYLWYRDTDGDGFGSAEIVESANATPGDGESDSNTDCNDANAGINPQSTDIAGSGIDANCDGMYLWYADNDGDGYGRMITVSSSNATPGEGESENSDDCDDNNADEFPGQTWYADTDGDGFGDAMNTQQSCEQPLNYVLNSDDCNDSDSNIVGPVTWYADTDGDGFGDPMNTQESCEQPAGFILDNSDCDDSDATINTDGTDVAGSGVDANCDGNYLWFVDADGDGFGTSQTVSSSNSSPGAGESSSDTDCDDMDANEYPGQTWYADEDGDGFGDPSNTQVSCEQPAGFILNNTDCDDSDTAVNANGTDVAGSGVDANCDGNYLWFVDADGDGFGTSETVSSPNASPGNGESAVDTDCDDTDASINPDAAEAGKNCVVLSTLEKEPMKIYPNPTSDFIHLPDHIKAGTIVILYGLNGEVIQEESLSGDHLIDLQTLPNGTYFIKTIDGNGNPVEWKVVKVKN